ncbi:MAG: type II secretion system protein [Candidatus Komeilibacteria bacterium]
MRQIAKKSNGFTLIELLVVIAIIGLLSVMAVVSFNNARAKARDARREGDLKQLNNAIQLYVQTNDAAPLLSAGDDNSDGICTDQETCWTGTASGSVASDLSQYSSPLPLDPHPESSTGYYYAYVPGQTLIDDCSCTTCNNESYQLYAIKLESTDDTWGFNDSECSAWMTP